jgi:adenylate cyclase
MGIYRFLHQLDRWRIPMAPTNSSMLATFSQVSPQGGGLTRRVKDLPAPQFIDLLDQITREFEHFLRAIDMINNESLENMLEQILEAFTLKIGQILQADRTTIFMVDWDKQELWSKIAQGDDEARLEIRVPVGKGIAGHVAESGECLNIPDAYASDLFNPKTDKETGYRTHSILCIPVFNKANETVVAVVQLLNKLDPSNQPTALTARMNAASENLLRPSALF